MVEEKILQDLKFLRIYSSPSCDSELFEDRPNEVIKIDRNIGGNFRIYESSLLFISLTVSIYIYIYIQALFSASQIVHNSKNKPYFLRITIFVLLHLLYIIFNDPPNVYMKV